MPHCDTLGTILVVEDAFVARFLGSLLSKSGFRVVPATVQRGLDLLRSAHDVDLLITNTPARFAEVGRRIPLLYLAACPDDEQLVSFLTSRALRKPFTPGQLLEAVAELTDSVRAVR